MLKNYRRTFPLATTNLTPKFPFFDLTRQYETLKQEILPVVHKVFEKQAFVMGEEVTQFEKEVADYIGVKYAVTCSSGTDALVLALKTLGIGPGDEVITPPFSFFASTSSILLCGAKPIFVDIEPKHFNLDPEKVAAAITPRTKAIMPVHLFGQCADMDPILKVAKSKGIRGGGGQWRVMNDETFKRYL
jgi:dTDP-4-amino-4,6-dideoxygalactose transaminase